MLIIVTYCKNGA